MKPQDFVFGMVFVGLLFSGKPRLLVWAGLISLVLSIPLFTLWIFFTAERLTWYAAAFFAAYVVVSSFRRHTVQ